MIGTKHVTVDGLAFSGKTTLSQLLATRLGGYVLSSGAAYRSIAAYYLAHNKLADVWGLTVSSVTASLRLEVVSDKEKSTELSFAVNDLTYSTDVLRSEEVDILAPAFAQYEEVRALVSLAVRNATADRTVVLDGRDAGSTILPSACLKLIAVCPLKDRVARRCSRLGQDVSWHKVAACILARDILDLPRMKHIHEHPEEYLAVSTVLPLTEENIDTLEARVRG